MSFPQPQYTKPDYKVLMWVDFTDHSRRAVEFVAGIFADRITHLYLLHSYHDRNADGAPMVSLNDILRERSMRLMRSEIEFLGENPLLGQVQIVPIHRLESLLEALVDVAAKEDVDLVALPSEGYRPKRLSNPEDDPNYMLQKLHRPLLLVPKLLN